MVEGRLFEVPGGDVSAETRQRPAGEDRAFRPYDPDQVLLLSPVLSEWVPEGDLAHFGRLCCFRGWGEAVGGVARPAVVCQAAPWVVDGGTRVVAEVCRGFCAA